MDDERVRALHRTLAGDFKAAVKRDLDPFLNTLRTGQARERQNPFTKKPYVPAADAKALALRERLELAGLLQDDAFMTMLTGAIGDLAEGPVWSIMAAFDGEGAWASGTFWQVGVGGEVFPTHVHEVYAQA